MSSRHVPPIGGAFAVMSGLPLAVVLVIAAAANGWAARPHAA